VPSTILSRASGQPFPIVSGNYWSGQGVFHPVGGIQLRLSPDASGNAFVGLSGGMTANSGGFLLSGSNVDGMLLRPGDPYFIPKIAFISGQVNVYATCDATCSGQARLYWEVM